MPRTYPDEPRFLHRKFEHPGAPTVSVVIPSLDGHRGGNVELLFESLQEQTHPPLEAIVAIGLRPQGRARNRGAERAVGDFLLFIDDDIELREEETIAKLLETLRDETRPVGVAAAAERLPTYSNDFQRRSADQVGSLAKAGGDTDEEARPTPRGCRLIRRDLFLEHGGESEVLRRESGRDLFDSIERQGLSIRIVSDAPVGHPAPENWEALLNASFQAGEAAAEERRYYSKRRTPGVSDPLEPMREVEDFFGRTRDWGMRTANALMNRRWIGLAHEIGTLAGWISGKALDLNRNRVLFDRGLKASLGAIGQIRRLKHPPQPALRILTYHRIEDIPGFPLCVPRKEFQKQLDYLLDQGLVIDFEEAMAHIHEERPAMKNRVAIAFDDGFGDNATHALPVLEERGIKACFFLVTGRIGGLGEFGWMKKHGPPNYRILNWDEARRLRDAGMTIGSHSAGHERLALLHDDESRRSIEESLSTLERELGAKPVCFAYPYGREGDFGDREIEILKQAGVGFAFTAEYGAIRKGADPFRLPRIDIDASDGFETFKSKVHGDFDSLWPWSRSDKGRPVEEPI